MVVLVYVVYINGRSGYADSYPGTRELNPGTGDLEMRSPGTIDTPHLHFAAITIYIYIVIYTYTFPTVTDKHICREHIFA